MVFNFTALLLLLCASVPLSTVGTRLGGAGDKNPPTSNHTVAIDAGTVQTVLCPGAPQPSAALKVAPGFRGGAVLGGLSNPREITRDTRGNLLVVERGKGLTGHVVDRDSGCVRASRVVVDDVNLNHGVDVSRDGKRVFATSREHAWMWDYDAATMTATNRRVLVFGMSTEKQLTRSIIASKTDPKYIMISISAGDGPDFESFDPAVGRSQIRAFDWTNLPPGGAAFNSSYGSVVGYGLANVVGIAEDNSGFVHAGDNGVGAYRFIDGAMIPTGNDNPADAMYKLSRARDPKPLFAGYPYCYTVWDVDGIQDRWFKVGQWSALEPQTARNDDWCERSTVTPTMVLPAHSAPLGITFGARGDENMYISVHGNGFNDPTKGFKVVSVNGRHGRDGWASKDRGIVANAKEILANDVSYAEQCLDGKCFRPLGLVWSADGKSLYVTSDVTGEILLLRRV